MKKCSKCGIEKPLSEFVKHKNCKDGYENTCKICTKQYKKEYYRDNKDNLKEYYKEYRENNKDKIKEYRENNKDKVKESNKKYYEENKEKLRKQMKQRFKKYYENNKEKIRDNAKKYYEENKEKVKESNKEYRKKKRKTDPIYRMTRNIRCMVSRAIKTKRTEEIIGCTYQELKLHLENQFTEGMSWENYGKWHIDHIRPLSWFDIANPDEVALANHYSNLQPLWEKDNLIKGNRFAS